METRKRRRAELDELAAALKGAAANGRGNAEPSSAAGEPGEGGTGADDDRAILRDVERAFSAAAEGTEHIVASHPLAAVAAAFLLGLMVGRMGGRS